ncbi:MAG: DUF4349 domain-containing protein [Dehalococcoidia bacterium]|nr:DUF4349 domain-containing protein [Dehalococcoidia bacterium]
MKRLLLATALLVSLLVVACGGNDSPSASSSTENRDSFGGAAAATAAPFPTGRPAAPAGPQGMTGVRGDASQAAPQPAPGIPNLAIAGRMVIAVASISIEVEDVEASIAKVRAAAEGLGGFVEQLTSSTANAAVTATMTVRVPQPRFFEALDHLGAVGKITNRAVGSTDVTDQFIDLQARLKSAQTQETSLLRLMERVSAVSDVLTLEREIARIRAEIERYQGQLNFLARRVDLATITVRLNKPLSPADAGRPPRADMEIKTRNPEGAGAKLKAIVLRHNGVMDSYSVSTEGGQSVVYAAFRVLPGSFITAVSEVRGLGKMTRQSVDEGKAPEPGADVKAERPTAVVSLSIAQEPAPFPAWALALSIGLPIALGLMLLAGAVMVYQRSQRRTVTPPSAGS